jgi:hypothetical protein
MVVVPEMLHIDLIFVFMEGNSKPKIVFLIIERLVDTLFFILNFKPFQNTRDHGKISF